MAYATRALRPSVAHHSDSFTFMHAETNSAEAAPPNDSALVKAQRVQGVVEECAIELGTVNETMRELVDRTPGANHFEKPLGEAETIEEKVQVCAVELNQVNEALSGVIEERHALEGALERARVAEEKALQAALHDPLTGLPNRTLLADRMTHAVEQAERHQRIVAVLFVDLDSFKVINDTHGHHVGDQILKAVSSRLRAMKRAGDTVSRHGGDEFVHILLDIHHAEDAVTVARKINAAVAEPIEVDGGITLQITSSVGISIYPNDASDRAGLLERADSAMYRAKRKPDHVALSTEEPVSPLPGLSLTESFVR